MKTESHNCPKCNQINCFTVFETPLSEYQLEWFKCSFCERYSSKKEWINPKSSM